MSFESTVQRNPILDSNEDQFRSSCRKTQFSDISHVDFEGKKLTMEINEEKWRSSSKSDFCLFKIGILILIKESRAKS